MLGLNLLCLKRRRKAWSPPSAHQQSPARRAQAQRPGTRVALSSPAGRPMAPTPPLPVTEDTPPDMLAGSMDLRVVLPSGRSVKMSVERGTPMMDLLVQVATANKIPAGGHVIQAVGERGLLPYKPSTPIGALDTWTIQVVPKSRSSSTTGSKSSNQQPFEQTFRLQVHLPRNQLFVARVSPKTLLSDVLALACSEKNLDSSKYELRHPANLEERLRPDWTLADYKLQEVTMVAKRGRPLGAGLSSSDIMALQKEEEKRRQQTRAGGSTGSAVLGLMFNKRSQSSVCDGSVSSDSLGGRSISPVHSDDTPSPPGSSLPPPRPARKRRPAPKPPGPPAAVISHSRNSSDSSGYHEASVLSESPESNGLSSSPSGTLPRRSKLTSATPAPPPNTALSRSLSNLTAVTNGGNKVAPRADGMRKCTHSVSTSSLASSGHGKKKKAAPPPPPAGKLQPQSTVSSQSSLDYCDGGSEIFKVPAPKGKPLPAATSRETSIEAYSETSSNTSSPDRQAKPTAEENIRNKTNQQLSEKAGVDIKETNPASRKVEPRSLVESNKASPVADFELEEPFPAPQPRPIAAKTRAGRKVESLPDVSDVPVSSEADFEHDELFPAPQQKTPASSKVSDVPVPSMADVEPLVLKTPASSKVSDVPVPSMADVEPLVQKTPASSKVSDVPVSSMADVEPLVQKTPASSKVSDVPVSSMADIEPLVQKTPAGSKVSDVPVPSMADVEPLVLKTPAGSKVSDVPVTPAPQPPKPLPDVVSGLQLDNEEIDRAFQSVTDELEAAILADELKQSSPLPDPPSPVPGSRSPSLSDWEYQLPAPPTAFQDRQSPAPTVGETIDLGETAVFKENAGQTKVNPLYNAQQFEEKTNKKEDEEDWKPQQLAAEPVQSSKRRSSVNNDGGQSNQLKNFTITTYQRPRDTDNIFGEDSSLRRSKLSEFKKPLEATLSAHPVASSASLPRTGSFSNGNTESADHPVIRRSTSHVSLVTSGRSLRPKSAVVKTGDSEVVRLRKTTSEVAVDRGCENSGHVEQSGEPLQSLQVIRSILNPSSQECASEQRSRSGSTEKETAAAEVVKRYRYSPPAVNLSTWNERPKSQVSIKLDSDYRISPQELTPGETPQATPLSMRIVSHCNKRTPSFSNQRANDENSKENHPVVVRTSSYNTAQIADPSRIPIVRAVELKKSFLKSNANIQLGWNNGNEAANRNNVTDLNEEPETFRGVNNLAKRFSVAAPTTECVRVGFRGNSARPVSAYLYNGYTDSSEPTDMKRNSTSTSALNTVGMTEPSVVSTNGPKKYTSVVGINGAGVTTSSFREPEVPRNPLKVTNAASIKVNGFAVPKQPMPVVKGFRYPAHTTNYSDTSLVASTTTNQRTSPGKPAPTFNVRIQHTPVAKVPVPPPAPVPTTRPRSLAASQPDSREQLMDAIRNFGGRGNLKQTGGS